MIIDFHTHIFPPDVRDRRDEFLRRDPTFAEMYASPKAKIATAQELLASMDEAGVDVSVALGFAWRDHELCVRHNDYLLESAAKSGGRIIPFCTINMAADHAAVTKEVARCVRGGARGLGELRPESQGWDLNGEAGERLAALAARWSLILLFHVTEPVGHDYPGKQGLSLESFHRFLVRHTSLTVVGAHVGGGLPFKADASKTVALSPLVHVDTAAQPFLYEARSLDQAARILGAERVLFGSDYPLVSQSRQIEEVRSGVSDVEAQPLILGANAERLLGLEGDDPGK